MTRFVGRGPQLPIPNDLKCPTGPCSGVIQFHSETMWCNVCGWAKNRYMDPATDRYTERKVKL